LYLNLVTLAAQANQALYQLSQQQTQLQQDNQALQQQQGKLQSPGYIARRASEMGMQLADPGTVQTIVLPPKAAHSPQPAGGLALTRGRPLTGRQPGKPDRL
jgi:cell division protein FtsL